MLKTFCLRTTGVNQSRGRARFREQLAAVGATDPVLALMAETFIPTHKMLIDAMEALETELRAIAKESALAQRLMTVPSVGVMVSLSFIATIDDAERFQKATDVGAFLGLTPRHFQSGEMDYSGRISECGDTAMRALLLETAA